MFVKYESLTGNSVLAAMMQLYQFVVSPQRKCLFIHKLLNMFLISRYLSATYTRTTWNAS